jgi:transposase
MARVLVPEDLWCLIAAHLPTHRPSPKGGRPRIDDRAALTGILFVLKTGIPWEYLPRELGCGSGMTCLRRLHEWMLAGVWQRVHEAILRRLREHDQIMWDRACVDAASVPAPAGGEHTGRNPTDRGKLGCKHHLLVDERGLPLVAQISGAQVHDSRFLIPLIESIPAVKGLAGAYFGDRDRPFRRIVTTAQRAVSRTEILVHAVTIMRFFPLVRHSSFVPA